MIVKEGVALRWRYRIARGGQVVGTTGERGRHRIRAHGTGRSGDRGDVLRVGQTRADPSRLETGPRLPPLTVAVAKMGCRCTSRPRRWALTAGIASGRIVAVCVAVV